MKIIGLLIFLFSASITAFGQGARDVGRAINGFNEIARSAGLPSANCNGRQSAALAPIEVVTEGDPNLYYQQVELNGDWQNQKSSFEGDEVSVLTEEQARELFIEFSRIEYMKFDYLHDGCFDRAHEFALIAKNHGIEMGKVFLRDAEESASLYPKEWLGKEDAPVPQGFVGWRYHVAPYVLVKKGNELVPFTFDVGVSEGPKSLQDWQKDLNPRNKRHRTTFKDRGFLFEDSRWELGDESSIAEQIEDQNRIRELGIDEFLYGREQGWF